MKKFLFLALNICFFQLLSTISVEAQACKPDTRLVERPPVGPGTCMGKPGSVFNRTICNVPRFPLYDPLQNEIMVPATKTAGCFVIVSSTGTPVWKIVDASTSSAVYRSSAPIGGLSLPGGGAGKLFKIYMDATASSPGASVTIGYIVY